MIEILEKQKDGFSTLVTFEGWKVAFITHSVQYDELREMKRHMQTDEVFSLIDGSATFYIVDGNEIITIDAEKGKVYNVKKGTWHHVKVSKDGLLIVTENSNTTKENTQSRILSEKEIKERKI